MLYYPYGVLAQLGARNIRIVEATGSSPVYSIEKIKQEDFAHCYDGLCLKKVNQITAEKS